MRSSGNVFDNDFLFDDRYDDIGVEGDVFEDGDAYALEDLLHLVQQQSANEGDGAEDVLTSTPFLTDEDALIWGLSVLCGSSLGRAMAFDARFEDW